MLRIDNTPNDLGIQIHGDYDDLYELREAIFRYLDFYYDNQYALLKAMHEDGRLSKKAFDGFSSDNYQVHEFLLALCYDIRHAYQGDRDVEFVDNHSDGIGRSAECIYEIPEELREEYRKQRANGSAGNVYYSVPILYPLMEYYILQLSNILEEYYADSWFQNIDFEYNALLAERDRSLIRLMISLYHANLAHFLGERTAANLSRYFDYTGCPNESTTFPEAMCQYYAVTMKRHPGDEELKKALLTAIFYEQITTEELLKNGSDAGGISSSDLPGEGTAGSTTRETCETGSSLEDPDIPYNRTVSAAFRSSYEDYTASCGIINEKTGKPFKTYDNFSTRLYKYVMRHGGTLYEETFDAFQEKEYGKFNWDRLVW